MSARNGQNAERRPDDGGGSSASGLGGQLQSTTDASADQRRALGLGRYLLDDDTARWCEQSVAALAEGREVPVYGSDAWRAADMRLQVAAAIRAGEAYRRDELFLPTALADALAAEDHFEQVREAEEFRKIAKQVQAMGRPSHRTHAELVALRAEVTRPERAA